MRRISLALALVGAMAATGCSGGAKNPADTGAAPGVAEGTFTVTIQNGLPRKTDGNLTNPSLAIIGGKVVSTTPASAIDCGVGGDEGKCIVTFTLGTVVTLEAQPVAPNVFHGWAGDCTTSAAGAATCTLSGNADKYVVVTFGAAGGKVHPNWSADGSVHPTEYAKWNTWVASGVPTQPADVYNCAQCHGGELKGVGTAPACYSCHHYTLDRYAEMTTMANGPQVTALCLKCHSQQASDFMQTQHWTWQGPTPQLFDVDALFQPSALLKNPGTIGKSNLINNFCVSVAANEKRCDQCHAGYGDAAANLSARTASLVADPKRVDCLICHSKTVKGNMAGSTPTAPAYNKIAGAFGAAGSAVGPGVPSATNAQLQVFARNLQRPSRENCGWCHFNGGGADSVKVMSTALRTPSASVDVHMSPQGVDMSCADCHADSDHKVKGAGIHTPTNTARTSCESCHGAAPHALAQLNAHLDTVACQTCHIPAYSRGMPGKVDWDWSTAGWKTPAFPHPATVYACVTNTVEVAYDGNNCLTAGGTKVKKYDYMKGTFAWAQNVPPVYAWYNGKMTHVTTDDKGAFTVETGLTPAISDRITLSSPLGSRADATAKIYPFKLMTGRQAVYVDGSNSFIITPNLFAETGADGGFWGVISAQPPGTVHTYEYTSAVTPDGTFGAPAGPLAGNFVLGIGAAPAGTTGYAGYTFGTSYSIETLLSAAFTKGAKTAGQYDSAAPTMVKFDGTNAGWDWRYTKMYMDLEHEVAPAAQALSCSACHGAAAGNTPFFQAVGYTCDPMYDAACRRTP